MTAMAGPADGGAEGTRQMRAAVVRRHGAPPEFGTHPAPRRGAGQALIRVTAAPVNPLDLLCATGTSYFGAPALPYAPGAQGVGVIAEADALPAGLRVWFSCNAGMQPGDGAMAELCLAEESSVLPLPDGVDDDLVAALGLSAIAAWMALTWRGGLQPGEHVLVLGASGTVGQVGVQAARLLGAGRVTAACRDAHGRLVNLGSSAAAQASVGSATLRGGTLSVLGYTNNALSPEQKAAALDEILAHAAAGRLTADRETLPLARAAEGWSRCGQAPHRRAVLIP